MILVGAFVAGCGGAPAPGSEDDNSQTVNGSANDNGYQDNDGTTGFLTLEDENPLLADQPFVEDELITMTYPGADTECVASAVSEAGASVIRSASAVQVTIVRVDPDRFIETASALEASPLIESVHKNYLFSAKRFPDDPRFAEQTHLEHIQAQSAWDITTGSAEMTIAVLDTGVLSTHADLSSRMLDGWNTFDNNGDTSDVVGHGTSVTGVIAASGDNALGITGVTWVGKTLPVRVANVEGLASAESIADGIVWAADHGARIANVSFAPLHADETIRRAAQYMRSAGGLVFISAGNDGSSHPSESYEAAIFVGAVNSDTQLASFSSTGPFVDLVAPGVAIRTTSLDGGYTTVSGTSFASPIAAGVASLVWSVRPQWRPDAVARVLSESAVDLGPPGRDDSFGDGMIDAAAAVALARSLAEEADEQPPQINITSPANEALIDDFATVVVEANDMEGAVEDVVLYIDGEPFATDSFAPYRFVVDVASLNEGPHTFTCIATDVAGNASPPVEVRVIAGGGDVGDRCVATASDPSPPGGTIEYPIDGATVTGSIGIRATVTDNAGLQAVAIWVDGNVIESHSVSGVRATVDFVWNAEDAAAGPHTLSLRVTDVDGNQSETNITLHKL